ncbi:uncharacterized protein F4822DRAFT_420938 [Hypoxylon trugodes]|uniref:uncharacterized protein n=1 Tax=Hypoxylon trugodes TaxID=326681 RepID=UPI00219F3A67|nr:uncharacterized protein F4822DRAFT_420938 [Hypoxylon trugodes]KAI1383546.1 hypothetical protein F4822DRAFT_420938 [Hypoxylon trugodes]
MTPHFFTMAKTVYNPNVVKPRNRELAILGLCSVVDAPYLVYCHRGVAAHVGLTLEQFEDGLRGTEPTGLDDEELTAYRLGRILAALTGPLDEQKWRETTKSMDKTEIVGITHLIGGYRWVALLEQVNGGEQTWTHGPTA